MNEFDHLVKHHGRTQQIATCEGQDVDGTNRSVRPFLEQTDKAPKPRLAPIVDIHFVYCRFQSDPPPSHRSSKLRGCGCDARRQVRLSQSRRPASTCSFSSPGSSGRATLETAMLTQDDWTWTAQRCQPRAEVVTTTCLRYALYNMAIQTGATLQAASSSFLLPENVKCRGLPVVRYTNGPIAIVLR